MRNSGETLHYCGFCGRQESEIGECVGPKPRICAGCVAMCVTVLAERAKPNEAKHLEKMRQALSKS